MSNRPIEVFEESRNYKVKLRLASLIILSTINFNKTGNASMWHFICDCLQRFTGNNNEEIESTVANWINVLNNDCCPTEKDNKIDNKFRITYMDWNDITYRIFVNPDNNDIGKIEVASMNDEEDYIKAKLRTLLEHGKIELIDALN